MISDGSAAAEGEQGICCQKNSSADAHGLNVWYYGNCSTAGGMLLLCIDKVMLSFHESGLCAGPM
jgi:hypothetical protein